MYAYFLSLTINWTPYLLAGVVTFLIVEAVLADRMRR